MEVNAYRAKHPIPTEQYQPWPVAIALLQQPLVPFSGEKERKAYVSLLDDQETRLKQARGDTSSVRAGDAPYFDQLIHDTHKKAAEEGYRPAKAGDKGFDAVLDEVVARAGTPWGVYCKRQIVDGEEGISWVIQMWTYNPRGGTDIHQWTLYNGPRARM